MKGLPHYSHCSAGVGRSGIISLMDRLERLGELDRLKESVKKLSPAEQLNEIEGFAALHIIEARDRRSWAEGASVIQTYSQFVVVVKLIADYIHGYTSGVADSSI